MPKNKEGVPAPADDPNDDPAREHSKSPVLHRETEKAERGDAQNREREAQNTVDKILEDADLELDDE